MAKVTQNLKILFEGKNSYHFRYFIRVCVVMVLLYTPETLNINIEQEYWNMAHIRTPQEIEFLKLSPQQKAKRKHTIESKSELLV